ncbi:MAG: UvrD-helicase domain-containing protein [Synergistaceae bacterium]|nr:UvrD-helicase domain-containing protein [Synergistaceae bacterium]
MDNILLRLSEKQIEAVTYKDGPLLILAGAGSGKTRVLTHKVAWLISEGIASPDNIMAVTFTNKAAGEMRTRIDSLVSGQAAERVRAGTFHGYGLRFLFRHHEAARDIVALREGFTVFDRDDSRSMLAEILSERKSERGASDVLDIISRDYMTWSPESKNSFISNQEMREIADEYRLRLRKLNAVDFDDLMILPLEVMSRMPEIRAHEQDRITWLLVDEYQDVNKPQSLLLKYLVGRHCTINAVGDPDQSIYGWRGADINVILNFMNEFPRAKTIKLEENYRSTKMILNASNALIRNNSNRLKKTLYTAKKTGDKVCMMTASSDLQEADFLVQEIDRLRRARSYSYSDIAVLYRQNSMSRLIEKKFLENDVPYRIIRGLSFYERMEVKDVLAILKLAMNPSDALSLERVSKIHSIIEGMGPKSLGSWGEWIDSQLFGVLNNPAQLWSSVEMGAWKANTKKARESMQKFASHMCAILDLADDGIRAAVDYVLGDMGYGGHLMNFDKASYYDRVSNVNELKSIVPDGNLRETLAEAALFTDADTQDDSERDAVGLMTLHASKGLEFPVVFMIGLEEDIFPHRPRDDCRDSEAEMEEERRLCYVGMTRAEEKLYMTCALSRMLYGSVQANDMSRFLLEIPDEFKEIDDRSSHHRETIYTFKNAKQGKYGSKGNNGRYRFW